VYPGRLGGIHGDSMATMVPGVHIRGIPPPTMPRRPPCTAGIPPSPVGEPGYNGPRYAYQPWENQVQQASLCLSTMEQEVQQASLCLSTMGRTEVQRASLCLSTIGRTGIERASLSLSTIGRTGIRRASLPSLLGLTLRYTRVYTSLLRYTLLYPGLYLS